MDMNLKTQIGLVECLALFQHRRDDALGLVHVTKAQRGLLWYRNTLARRAVSAALHAGVIKEIVSRAEVAGPEELPVLLQVAQAIHEKVRMGGL